MQVSTQKVGVEANKSFVEFLPIIDLNPSNETCLYTTLTYVLDHSRKLNLPTTSITFDQPLWYKSTCIIIKENLPIVCRLGGFHTMMCFLSSIGYLMHGSGLEEVLEEVYASNTVPHMMSGKAVARAIRGHFIVQNALTTLLVEDHADDVNFDFMKPFYDKAVNEGLDDQQLDALLSCEDFKIFSNELEQYKQRLKNSSRTAKLWLLYNLHALYRCTENVYF